MISPLTILLAFVIGVLPALLWLWFWLHEDSLHPEPRRVIVITFIIGMIATLPALFMEGAVCSLMNAHKGVIGQFLATNLSFIQGEGVNIECLNNSISGTLALMTIVIWVVIEELIKFGAIYFSVLHRKENNEPIDSLIYLITGALGFAAAENTLYVLGALGTNSSAMHGILLGNFRFLGATLLHTVSTGAIGLALALSYFKPKLIRIEATVIGIIIAVVLHTLFNLFILNGSEGNFLITFGGVWLASIILLLFFEKVKEIHQKFYPTESITESL